MSPEQTSARPIDRRSDVFSAGILLWELLAGDRLFAADNPISSMAKIVELAIVAPSVVGGAPAAMDPVVMKALSRDPADRFDTATQMATALRDTVPPASAEEVAKWLDDQFGEAITAPRGPTLKGLSVARNDAATLVERPKRPQWLLIVVAAAAGAALSALGLRSRPTVRASLPAPATSTAAPVASAPPTESAAPLTMLPEPPAPALASVATAASRVGASRPIPHLAPHPRPATSHPDCDPPYTVRSDGLHVAKPECLR
jgi:serine/threonine-protein kinase